MSSGYSNAYKKSVAKWTYLLIVSTASPLQCSRFQWFLASVLQGSIKVGGEDKVHQAFHTVVLSADANENGVNLEAMEDGTELCLVG